jgi:hypothetical protein
MNNGSNQRIQVPINEFELEECECGGTIFQNAHEIRSLSAVHPKNPTGEKQIGKLPVNVCLNCGNVISDHEFKQ